MNSELHLDPHEARVLGVLVEKELTTPDQYPLTLNAATNGSNQKNNRDPVLELTEREVEAAMRKMIVKGLVGSVHPVGSRVEKFRHNAETVLAIDKPKLAVLTELLLRGVQQPGELRGRASRMSPIDSLGTLAGILGPMMEAGLIVRLDPAPGSRAERYGHTLSGHVSAAPKSAQAVITPPPEPPAASVPDPAIAEHALSTEKRIEKLEYELSRLHRQLGNLAWKLGEKLEG